MSIWAERWRFETARFRIALETRDEPDYPEDHFDDRATVELIQDGQLEWFMARVVIYLDGLEIESDHLGACCYETMAEFFQSHRDPDPMNRNCEAMRAVKGANAVVCHYFPDMVAQAIRNARAKLANVPRVRVPRSIGAAEAACSIGS